MIWAIPVAGGPKLPNRKVQGVHAKPIPKFQNILQKVNTGENEDLNISATSDGYFATWA